MTEISVKILNDNDSAIVATDESDRLSITNNSEISERTEDILKDKSTNEVLTKSKNEPTNSCLR